MFTVEVDAVGSAGCWSSPVADPLWNIFFATGAVAAGTAATAEAAST
ncbi:MAG TPA: hypothetical protein VD834_11105 [Blastococcus sp.]|nr:hypothetical protein [Blastococcus sp.]